MCCFSGTTHVTQTRIFARFVSPDRQLLVYQMRYSAREPVAMILPIPVKVGVAEDAVAFLSLEDDPDFFARLERLFPAPKASRGMAPAARGLAVHVVGHFEASFVPTQADFERLDPRFRIDPALWSRLPVYDDYGFVVFQLREPQAEPHPMAFTFPTRMPGHLYFPTLHIHDNALGAAAEFDHRLFLQADALEGNPRRVTELRLSASDERADASSPHLTQGARVYVRTIKGVYRNQDVVVSPDSAIGPPPAIARVEGGFLDVFRPWGRAEP